jgi:hypothetical protein
MTNTSSISEYLSQLCYFCCSQDTVLLTDLLDSKITLLASSGRAIKEFVTDPGSQPWCSCVTPKGHVAVTLRRLSCVTVWSGHGSLVREFGQDVFKCPTGIGGPGDLEQAANVEHPFFFFFFNGGKKHFLNDLAEKVHVPYNASQKINGAKGQPGQP